MKRLTKILLILVTIIIGTGCSSLRTDTQFYDPVLQQLERGNYEAAAKYITDAAANDHYSDKDKVLEHLDKGILFHYQGEYDKSNTELTEAENLIDDLFTKSISKGAASLLLNDNALAYDGEVYEDIYINIFKALNYINLAKTDEAYVEIKKVNVKLQSLDNKYESYVEELNESEDAKIDINAIPIEYYNNALANYLSHLVFRADDEYDNSRISLEQTMDAFKQYPHIYDFPAPTAVTNTTNENKSLLNILAFAGPGPQKEAVGARISTFDGFIMVSDPSNYWAEGIPFPGIKGGYNFKFSFPKIYEPGSFVERIEIFSDGRKLGEAELIENLAKVAEKTFQAQKGVTFFKTITRAVVKGLASNQLGKKLGKEAGGGLLGGLAQFATNVAFDATENADLRNWRTLPAYSFVAEFELEPGFHNISIRYIGDGGKLLYEKKVEKFRVNRGLNLIESFYLN
ncbi:MAG: lipoprotein [Melioribacteraceae bacterium]|nr:MAG: lipoprotein [Melioribacteraceae bacterium]